ncbi:MAG: alpha/beta hydrolase [Clostridia bacterium]|nr:alpha/beta hydrolase [Clostridia bacterium]
MKKSKKLKTVISVFAALFLTGIIALSLVSKLYYHRSLMATFVEIYLRVTDRNSLYCVEKKCVANIEEKAVTNLQDIVPPKKKVSIRSTHESGMQVFYINEGAENDGVLIYLHGGAYLNPPASQHWGFWDKLSRQADITIIAPIYLKCTNYTAEEAHKAMMDFYLDTVERYEGKKIYIGGDSSGGGFALSLAQQLREKETVQPEEIILICPWVDVSMENPDIEQYISMDAMLGDLCCADMITDLWKGDRDIRDPMISPLFGTFEDLGNVTLFIGTREVLYPDAMLLYEKMVEAGVNVTIHVKEGMSHVYPIFPIPEAAEAIGIMADIIR